MSPAELLKPGSDPPPPRCSSERPSRRSARGSLRSGHLLSAQEKLVQQKGPPGVCPWEGKGTPSRYLFLGKCLLTKHIAVLSRVNKYSGFALYIVQKQTKTGDILTQKMYPFFFSLEIKMGESSQSTVLLGSAHGAVPQEGAFTPQRALADCGEPRRRLS